MRLPCDRGDGRHYRRADGRCRGQRMDALTRAPFFNHGEPIRLCQVADGPAKPPRTRRSPVIFLGAWRFAQIVAHGRLNVSATAGLVTLPAWILTPWASAGLLWMADS